MLEQTKECFNILGETRLTDDVSQYPTISQSELETVLNYIISWPQR